MNKYKQSEIIRDFRQTYVVCWMLISFITFLFFFIKGLKLYYGA